MGSNLKSPSSIKSGVAAFSGLSLALLTVLVLPVNSHAEEAAGEVVICAAVYPCHETTGELLEPFADPSGACYETYRAQCADAVANAAYKQVAMCETKSARQKRAMKSLRKRLEAARRGR